MKTILSYDGTFEGFLSCIFYRYEYKLEEVSIQKKNLATQNFFDSEEDIVTDDLKAERVWKAITKKCTSGGTTKLYKAFLSELPQIEDVMLRYCIHALSSTKNIEADFGHPDVLGIEKTAKMVSREKHRMDAFVRFKLTREGIYFAAISPDFNVLPLNAVHFKNRYADQKWIIYDLKRNYGMYYNLDTVETVQLDLHPDIHNLQKEALYFTKDELHYQELWKNYFKSTTISSRKNRKLHVRHVPKRYWKFLTEKFVDIKN